MMASLLHAHPTLHCPHHGSVHVHYTLHSKNVVPTQAPTLFPHTDFSVKYNCVCVCVCVCVRVRVRVRVCVCARWTNGSSTGRDWGSTPTPRSWSGLTLSL